MDIGKLYDWYQSETRQTAIYPKDAKLAVAYLVLGLNNELLEFGNAPNAKEAYPELGDLFWFIAELANFLGTSLSILRELSPGLNEEGNTWNTPPGDSFAAAVINLELMELSGFAAKFIRDNTAFHDALSQFITRTVLTYEAIVDVMGVELEDVLKDNIAKLQSRKQRGTLQGSGNHR